MQTIIHPVKRIWNLIRAEKRDITSVYGYAFLNGLVQLSIPVGLQAIIGFVLGGVLSSSLVVLISLIVAGVMIAGLTQISQMKLIERIHQRIFVQYAHAFAWRIPRIDLKKADTVYLPELVNRFLDIASLQKSISKILLDLPTASIQIVFGLLLLSFYHPTFIFFSVLLIALLWLILRLTSNRGLRTSLAESSNKYALAGWFEELARVVLSFKFAAAGNLHLKKANQHTLNYLDARKQHFSILLLQYRTLLVFKTLITAAMLVIGVVLLINQQINIGQFVAAEIIIITVINAVEKLIMNLDSVYDTLTALEKLSKLTEKPLEETGRFEMNGEGIEIEARQLGYSFYPEKAVLKDVGFRVSPGQILCIRGREGSGKSTLLRLLAGAYSDYSGQLLVNGLPMSSFNQEILRQRTGIALQGEQVFSGTLWENITLGREVDKTLVTELIKELGLQEWISTQPQGYDTTLNPAGHRLPRNVERKLVFLRALVHHPKLVLLEEPWQGLEEQYRYKMQEILRRQSANSTIIVASNNDEFARACDQEITLN